MIDEDIVKLIKWEQFPKIETGGQTCGVIPRGMTLVCEEMGFKVSINNFRSGFKNKEMCLMLFELYLMEIK